MSQTHTVTVTNLGHQWIAKHLAQDGAATLFAKFRMGQGGYEVVGENRVNVNASVFVDNDDMDCVALNGPGAPYEDEEKLTGDGFVDGYYEVALTDADIEAVNEDDLWKVQITCVLLEEVANDRGDNTAPTFYEIGIFDSSDHLLIYGTFPGEQKNLTKSLTHVIKLPV